MRTTVTIDKDVERLLRDAMHKSRKSFKATLNDGLRAGLKAQTAKPVRQPFVVKPQSMGWPEGLDPTGFNKLVDELEADSFLQSQSRKKRK